jgi:hypothetical protein
MDAGRSETVIPRLESDLTAAWLSDALGRNITAVKTEPIGVGVGLVGTLFRLDVEGDGAPARMIAKLAAPTDEGRFVATVLNMYGREVGFYSELSSRTSIAHPRCYYHDHDAATQDTVLLLEDVSPRGAMLDQISGCTVAETGPAIETLARLHACFWEDATLGDHAFLLKLCDDPYPGAVSFAYSTAWPVAQELFADQITPRVKDFGDAYSDRIPALFAKLCEGPLVLSHADWRLDNLFQTPDREVIAVDWQLIDQSVPLRDLSYFVTESVNVTEPDGYQQLFDSYLSALSSHGVEPDRAWAWEMYRYGAMLGFVYPIVAAGALTIADPRHVELTGSMLRRSLAALAALDAFELPL